MPFDVAGFPIEAPVVETDPQRILRAAKAILMERGRTLGDLEDESGAVCLLGALGYTERDGDYISCAAGKAASAFCAAAIRERDLSGIEHYRALHIQQLDDADEICFTFNDARGVTDADVLAVLDRAYELAAS